MHYNHAITFRLSPQALLPHSQLPVRPVGHIYKISHHNMMNTQQGTVQMLLLHNINELLM
jgi:hypothetical protein